MKLARFDTLNINEAAKKAEVVELEKKVMEFLKDELSKQKMNRYEMIKKVEAKFEEKGIDKISRKVADNLAHDPLLTKLKVERETFIKNKENSTYYFIGDKAKDPADAEKFVKKERPVPGPKEKKEKRIKSFSEYKTGEKGAGLAKWREEQKKKKAGEKKSKAEEELDKKKNESRRY